ncbi:MAG: hypothetical protein R8G66_01150 [Cytophagales bacterium]|nr:hypothetical protein [Cytophagales bacterium]
MDVVAKNGSVKRLTREGIDFSDVAQLTDIAIAQKLLEIDNRNLIVTQKGIEVLADLELEFKNHRKEDWIQEEKDSKVGKLDKNVIFVPNQNELTFLLDKVKEQ